MTTTNFDRATTIIADVFRPFVKGYTDALGREVVAKLANAGLLPVAAEPRIIHTLAELESIDLDTVLVDGVKTYVADDAVAAIYEDGDDVRDYLPAVVIATGEHTRAARQTLEEADGAD